MFVPYRSYVFLVSPPKKSTGSIRHIHLNPPGSEIWAPKFHPPKGSNLGAEMAGVHPKRRGVSLRDPPHPSHRHRRDCRLVPANLYVPIHLVRASTRLQDRPKTALENTVGNESKKIHDIVLGQWYCWWTNSGYPVEVGSVSHYLQGFYTSQVVSRISSINCRPMKSIGFPQLSAGKKKALFLGVGYRRGEGWLAINVAGDSIHDLSIPKSWWKGHDRRIARYIVSFWCLEAYIGEIIIGIFFVWKGSVSPFSNHHVGYPADRFGYRVPAEFSCLEIKTIPYTSFLPGIHVEAQRSPSPKKTISWKQFNHSGRM